MGTHRMEGPERAVTDLSLIGLTNGLLPTSTAVRKNGLSKIN